MQSLNEKLIEIHKLLDLLGYDDVRSVRTWCKTNKVPLFVVGKRTYTVSNFLDLYLEKELKSFVDANYPNPDAVMDALNNDDKITLSNLIEAPAAEEVKMEFKKNKTRSKQSNDFLKQIKAA